MRVFSASGPRLSGPSSSAKTRPLGLRKKRPLRVAITGARGRWAGPLAAILSARGIQVDLYSRTEGGGIRDLQALHGQVARSYDAILSMAWPNVPFSSEQDRFHPMAGIKKILRSLARGPSPKTLFIFFSSCAVYGETHPSRPASERRRCRPLGHYAVQKLQTERLIQSLARRLKIPFCILRISNLFGVLHRTSVPQGIVPRLIQSARTGKRMEIWGNGTATKDFLHYRDLALALQNIIKNRIEGTFNVCAGRSHSLNEVIKKVEAFLGKPVKICVQPAQPWDVRRAFLSNSRFRRVAAWTPSVSLNQGLRQMIRHLPRRK